MAESPQFFLFRDYSIAIKEWIQDTCYLNRYPRDQNVTVVYGTPARAFAKYIYPTINGQQFTPVINFFLADSSYLEGENTLGFVKQTSYLTSTRETKYVKPLLMYGLTYSASIHVRLPPDADILLYQLMTSAHKNQKAWKIINGQWMEISTGNPRNETNLEPGEIQDKVIRYGIDITVPRAYLPRESYTGASIQDYELLYEDGRFDEALEIQIGDSE